MNIAQSIQKHFRFLSDAKLLEWYPAWWMMRIKVVALENEWRHIRIKLPLTAISKNMGGGMFGGFQASLVDPIAPLACAKVFQNYDVWTRKLEVDFRRAGLTDLELRFDFPPELERHIRDELLAHKRSTPTFEYGLYDAHDRLCTVVFCTVAIRPKGYLKDHKPLAMG